MFLFDRNNNKRHKPAVGKRKSRKKQACAERENGKGKGKGKGKGLENRSLFYPFQSDLEDEGLQKKALTLARRPFKALGNASST